MSKFMIERVLSSYESSYQLNYVILRYFNAAGADIDLTIGENHNPETHLIPSVFNSLLNNKLELKIFGNDYNTLDGTCIRDYIHVDDLAKAHYLAYEYSLKNNSYSFYNLGNGEGFSVLEILNACQLVSGLKIKYKILDRREGDSEKLVSNSDKAKRVLNWKIKYKNIEEILDTAWQWHKWLYNIRLA